MNRTSLLSAVLLALAASPSVFQGQEETPPPVRPPHRILLQLDQVEPAQMTLADRQVVTDRQTQLSSAVLSSGFDLQEGSWTYQQAVCPLFPGTILLRYESDPGTTHASRFIAVIPRGQAEVQVIPALRRGNTPFKSAYKNGKTMGVFNEVMDREGIKVDDPGISEQDRWVKLALCYAEMTGEHPTTLLTDTLYGEAFERNVNVPIRRVQSETTLLGLRQSGHSFVLEFSDVNDPKATVEWHLTFDMAGKLKEVSRESRRLNSPVRRLTTQTDLVPAPKAH